MHPISPHTEHQNYSIHENYYVGLMSGTSIDGIDAALITVRGEKLHLQETLSYNIPEDIKSEILSLCNTGDNEIHRMKTMDRMLGELFAKATLNLLQKANIRPKQVTAIGSHGQTIRHYPNEKVGYTLQIGDPNTISNLTGITTVADFRQKDVADGGQGAPLVPPFHEAVFLNQERISAVANIGGMANISLHHNNQLIGFDTGPGNVLMDLWINCHKGAHFDFNGDWASQGTTDQLLLDHMLQSEPYFAQPAPKSTGREVFNSSWLAKMLGTEQRSAADVQRTLLELTARTVSNALKELSVCGDVIVCGGGAHNLLLMARLQSHLQSKGVRVRSSAETGIDPDWVEACAFAWLAHRTLNQRTGSRATVTGAHKDNILGAVYYV
ncbi:anhydro-N-acetylmuramic acid kinase [Oleiphilus messinensis]|uniref:Anhydro-N-acetylmuramic acid kinase n=1 Tax=Oleiphilus messinensis TaxID=141451 RepID=A0A1Y0IE47_9GAMM|nr:anhydro-N-acetylmuramic acid kinase [Oleiphilus messinensis]ARU58721.1 anhydro-N-acetylmuramic acid kinase [Oleiphilus messinensis]